MAKYVDEVGLAALISLIKKADNDLSDRIDGIGVYTLPTAAADTLGGVKIGSGLSINDGVASVAITEATEDDIAKIFEPKD